MVGSKVIPLGTYVDEYEGQSVAPVTRLYLLSAGRQPFFSVMVRQAAKARDRNANLDAKFEFNYPMTRSDPRRSHASPV
jgi:hypothetical protein